MVNGQACMISCEQISFSTQHYLGYIDTTGTVSHKVVLVVRTVVCSITIFFPIAKVLNYGVSHIVVILLFISRASELFIILTGLPNADLSIEFKNFFQ